MKELIDKSAVVAEIKKLYKENYKFLPSDIAESVMDFKDELLMVLDSLSKVKEVDLEKELENWWKENYKSLKDDYNFNYTFKGYIGHYMDNSTIISLVKHFFELGLKTKKEVENDS